MIGRVLVVGDLILDAHQMGVATRLSPEAPVPVIELQQTCFYLGGAANVAANVASLGGEAWVVGMVGADAEAKILEGLIGPRLHAAWICDPTRPTTLKTRIIAQGQQLLRIDREQRHPADQAVVAAMMAKVEEILPKVDAVILSDYAKGALGEDFLKALFERIAPLPCIVDPKYPDTRRYQGATLLTPNEAEACQAAGTGDTLAAAAHLLKLHPAVLVTQGANGATLFRREQLPFRVEAQSRAVFDRTGAGDTVAATLGLALGAGFSLEQAVVMANHAAGIVVSKPGTAVVTQEEFGGEFVPNYLNYVQPERDQKPDRPPLIQYD